MTLNIKDGTGGFESALQFNNTANRSYAFPNADGTVALVGGAGVGTVTSVAALTLGTSGTDLSSTVANSTTTPVITLNVPTASATNRGALSSADWSTFNGKESVLTFSSPLVRTTNTISIPAATTSVNGYLTSTDWTTFNSKQGTITLTTTGTSGAATFSANTLNIPNYGSALSGYIPYTGTGISVYGLSAIGEYDGGAQIPAGLYGNYALTLGNGLTGNNLSLYASGNIVVGAVTCGALGGTSATFSSSVTAASGLITGTGDVPLSINSTINSPYLSFQKNSVDKWFLVLERNTPVWGMAANDFGIYNSNTSSINFKLANTTGAATFNSNIYTLGQLHVPNNSTGTLGGIYFDYNANVASRTWQIVSDYDAYGDFQIRQSTTQTGSTYSKILGFSPTGAATFSSSVNIGASTAYGTVLSISNTTNSRQFQFGYSTNAGYNFFQVYDGSSFQPLNINGTMHFTSDGNVYVGATSQPGAGNPATGAALGASGYIIAQRNSATAAFLGRGTNDGVILSFYKDTTPVGSISTNANSLPSDLNFKKNINNLDLGLNLITKLRPVTYNHKIDDDGAALSTGFIAQELEQSLKELGIEENKYYILQYIPNENETHSQYWLDYTKMIPVLVKAVQQQQALITSLQEQINELKNK
jgi:hypothetical protein